MTLCQTCNGALAQCSEDSWVHVAPDGGADPAMDDDHCGEPSLREGAA